MQTILDIDESVLKRAEQHARREGKTFAKLVEDALLAITEAPLPSGGFPCADELSQGLADKDPFFGALEEVRLAGRLPIPHRDVETQ